MGRTSYADIERKIDTQDVLDKAESDWREKQLNRNRFAKWLDRIIKWGLPLVAIVFYLQSAPHTAGMANRLTHTFGVAAPIGFEFLIFILATAMDRGLDKRGIKPFFYTAIFLTATLTIGGGIYSIMESSGGDLSLLSFQEIVIRFHSMPFINQFLLLFAIPYGIFVTLSAKIVAETSVGIVTGDVPLTSIEDDIEVKWMQSKFNVYKNSLYLAASRKGFPLKLSERWAESKSISLTNLVETSGTIEGLSNLSSSPSANNNSPENFGFVTQMTLQNIQKRSMDNAGQSFNGQSVRLTKDKAISWSKDNQEMIDSITRQGLTKRETAQQIAIAMGYDESSYKTVERYIL